VLFRSIFEVEKEQVFEGLPVRYKCGEKSRSSSAPDKIVNNLALRDNLGYPIRGMSLSAMNDTGKTFVEIAQIVRANPENYFIESR